MENRNRYRENQFGFSSGEGKAPFTCTRHKVDSSIQSRQGQCQIILRYITKAFDTVFKLRLNFKFLRFDLPHTTKKSQCDFIYERRACIKIRTHIGPSFT